MKFTIGLVVPWVLIVAFAAPGANAKECVHGDCGEGKAKPEARANTGDRRTARVPASLGLARFAPAKPGAEQPAAGWQADPAALTRTVAVAPERRRPMVLGLDVETVPASDAAPALLKKSYY